MIKAQLISFYIIVITTLDINILYLSIHKYVTIDWWYKNLRLNPIKKHIRCCTRKKKNYNKIS